VRPLPRVLIFDADGTLRWTTVPGQPSPKTPAEWRLLPRVRERLSALDWGARGHRLGIASNQDGVPLGDLSRDMARRLLRDTVEAALGFVPEDAAIEMCVCDPSERCPCRKPAPGMLRSILRRFRASPTEALFVGDLEIDREAARRAGIAFEWAHAFFAEGLHSSEGNSVRPKSR
jgi:HAD superfamily hydrolase (TIGR01662 family)